MWRYAATASESAPQPLNFGPCPKCKQPLRLRLIEPAKSGHDERVYECASCGYSETKAVEYR